MTDHRTMLGEQNRDTIVNYLLGCADKAQTFREISDATGLEYSTVHRHINAMSKMGIVSVSMLSKPRGGTRIAYVANDTSVLTLPNLNGKLAPAINTLLMIHNLGRTQFEAINDNERLKGMRKTLYKGSPIILAGLGIIDIFKQANGQEPAGYPRIAKSHIGDAIEGLEQLLSILKAIQASAPLWDRKALSADTTFAISPENLKSINEYLTSVIEFNSTGG